MAVIGGELEKSMVEEKSHGYEILTSECAPFEICNGISKLMKRGLISIEKGLKMYKEYKHIDMKFLSSDFENVLQIAGEEKHYAYDIFYLSKALELKIPLLTFDSKLISMAENRGVKCL